MKNRPLCLVALLFGLLPFLGCATIVKGTEQKVTFSSDPDGAKVSVFSPEGMLVAEGKTPVVLPLRKGDGFFQAAKYRVTFEAPGYQKKEIWLSGDLEAGWYLAGNLLIGGFVGWLIVDPATGAMWTLRPKDVITKMDPALSQAEDGSLHIVLASQVPPELMAAATPVVSKL